MIKKFLCGIVLTLAGTGHTATPAEFKTVGDWKVQVTVSEPKAREATLRVKPATVVSVKSVKYAMLPVFSPAASGWAKGAQLQGVKAQETTTPGLLAPDSFTLRAGPKSKDTVFQRGRDYEIDPVWGTCG